MWLITYLLKNNKNDSNPIRIEYKKVDENPETKALVDKKEKLEIKLMDIKGKYNLLKQALDSSLIDKSKFDCKMNELNLDKQDIEEQLKNIKHRIYALDILKDQFNSLDELVKNGILSIEEKLSKREELIIKIISNLE